MSPVFRHGKLRLYLLALLDESPRHGYEIIRLMRDRFLGVYAPSPGTVYPRLARLEEEGLVTHDVVDGKKVYRITDAGRAELHARRDDLTELEEELTASVRDIAREVTEDVRETVRNLREELTWAAREVHSRGRAPGEATGPGAAATDQIKDAARLAADELKDAARQVRDQLREGAREARDEAKARARQARDHAHQVKEDARQARDESRRARDDARRAWVGPDDDAAWEDEPWTRWPGWKGWPGPAGADAGSDPRACRDLERLARRFSRELRHAAFHAHAVTEDTVGELRDILEETIGRIRSEVFGPSAPPADAAAAETDTAAGETGDR